MRAPYHNKVVSEVIARQWWMGAHPEALKAEHRNRFDLTKPLSSNLIALVCTSVGGRPVILCATLHEFADL